MNDLVFVMCNLKLNNNQVKKQADGFGVEDDLSSDDDWITEGEKHSNIDLLGAIDIATRRKNDNEDESDEEEFPNDAEMESQNGAHYKVFYASPDEARNEIHQACFDYLSLGGVFSERPLSLLLGLNPHPLSLVAQFFAVAIYGVGSLLLPFLSPKHI
ncbi:hypothetical protein NC652_007787 [Populus alba x Populus x berolinensis]|nr:hypothetical protein NC652_007787 [Populus alba x Populus x berolinensis]